MSSIALRLSDWLRTFSYRRLTLLIPPRALKAMNAIKVEPDDPLSQVIIDALMTHQEVMEEIRNGATIHAHYGGGNFIPLSLEHIAITPDRPPPKNGGSPFQVIKGGRS